MFLYVRRGGRVYQVSDDYKKKKHERWVTEKDFIRLPSRGAMAQQEVQRLVEQEEERQELLRAAEEERQELLRAAEQRRKELRERKALLSKYPRGVTRRDRNFANQQNRRGQGKAHIVGGGLAGAGSTEIPPTEQLLQDSPNKGTSNLISFSGPKPSPGTVYGPDGSQVVTVKTRKLMRAKVKGKRDTAHLEVITSAELKELARLVPNAKQLIGYIRKDDEYQVRVRPLIGSLAKPVIPARFLVGPGGEETHDSDSESEDDS
jgi:hypothetical protein